MKAVSNVVFLGLRSNVSLKNGKTYHNVDFRSDGRNMTMGTRCPDAFTKLPEYQPVQIVCDLFTYNNSLIGNIVDVKVLKGEN